MHDIVTLSSTRGGWEGVISELLPGVRTPEYRIHKREYESHQNPALVVREVDIAGLAGKDPTFQVGDAVAYNQANALITAINGTDYTVEVTFQFTKHLRLTRTVRIPRWRLLIENE